ncbi:MAG: FAD-binding protein [Gammaproteobacteria bacterium]
MYCSWGYPHETHQATLRCNWRNESLQFSDNIEEPELYLPYGCGRSYGDVCLNDSQTLITTQQLNHFIEFDNNKGLVRVESGVTLDRLLEVIVPQGWFVPVTPGTRFVTIGGMIANDVHGKNHHNAGTFGCHVTQFELVRSNGERLLCSPTTNEALYNATIAGLGLTGLITWVEIKLKKIANNYIAMNAVKIENLQHYFELEKNQQSEYTVAWIDTLASGEQLGRGVYFSGEHADISNTDEVDMAQFNHLKKKLSVPFNLPVKTLNKYTVQLFNAIYIRNAVSNQNDSNDLNHYEEYFYPLDNILHWNRIYGKAGLYQHQCVVPEHDAQATLTEILNVVSKEDNSSFLSVLKKFGTIASPGLMSFPRPGFTLAMDFSRRGTKTVKLLETLNDIVASAGGAIYPAKDAIMSKQLFQQSYSNLDQFSEYIDPKFSSSFWRRVTA